MPNTARQVIPKSDTDYGTVGNNTVRTASQIGNSTGSADFGDGAVSAQTLRVTLADGASIGITPVSTGLYIYNENLSVIPASTTTVTSYTPTSNFFLMNVSASSDADGEFFIRVGGAVISKKRNCWTNRNVEFSWGNNGILVAAGVLVELVVIHKGQTNSLFNATIYGEA